MTDQGDTIFDPYMGVGSSLIAAVKHDRNAYGCDIDPGYVAMAIDRMARFQAGELPLRPMGRPIYDPRLSKVK